MNHITDHPLETATGDAALTSVANPRRTRVGAEGPAPLILTSAPQD